MFNTHNASVCRHTRPAQSCCDPRSWKPTRLGLDLHCIIKVSREARADSRAEVIIRQLSPTPGGPVRNCVIGFRIYMCVRASLDHFHYFSDHELCGAWYNLLQGSSAVYPFSTATNGTAFNISSSGVLSLANLTAFSEVSHTSMLLSL